MNQRDYISELNNEGYSILPNAYTQSEVAQICELISRTELQSESVLESKDLYAVRQLLNEIPELKEMILNEKIKSLLAELRTDNDFFFSKAIYFDKPEDSNWFVDYHQDLTINVEERIDTEGFKNWTNKRGQIGVQPPIEYLNRTVTLRIHLDDTDETNGALRVVPKSHIHGVIRTDEQPEIINEETCTVKRGDVMLMKPLILHASSRSTGKRNRRVIHLEFCDMNLPEQLTWKEKKEIEKAKHITTGHKP